MLAAGIDGAGITRTLMDTHPFGWLTMLSRVLGSARLEPGAAGGAGLVYAFVHSDDSEGLRSEEVESVIDVVRTTAEADIAAVFKQGRTDPERWTVSLRSRDSGVGAGDAVDVAKVATRLGGGGHRYAAGYTTAGAPEALVTILLDALDGAS